MSRAVGRVLAPFGALALVVLVVWLLGGSDVLAGRARPEAGVVPETTRTTVIHLTQPAGGAADTRAGEGVAPGSTSTPGEGSSGETGTSVSTSAATVGSQAGSAATTTTAASQASSDGSSGDGSTYTVKAGDTPYSIARAFGVSTQDLMVLNGIDDPTALMVGTVLRIPSD